MTTDSTGPAAPTAPSTLVTGGLGFLATWIAAGLLRCGHRVTLVDHRDLDGTPAQLSGITDHPAVTVARADVTEPGALDGLGASDHIIHMAAVLGVDKVRAAPAETLRVNIDGTAVALDHAARQPALRRFVLLSTSEVYGSRAEDATEDGWLSVRTDDPRWSYAVSKVTAEAMTAARGTEAGLPYTLVRPFNVYGPLRTGAYAVGALARQAVRGAPLTVHGDGRQRRAWCHAEDFANGLVRCLYAPGAVGRAVNIGDDRHHLSIAELARLTNDIGGGAGIVHTPPTGPDIDLRKPDLTTARTVLGHEPLRDLHEGLRETVEWFRRGAGLFPLRLHRPDWSPWALGRPGASAR
ncbi:NAD-dependent epimerase/dehydratase family protein [Streptomyces celluloflavus]|uniref:NAD-dependent epimerase/dehydratase family protein n=1 Tax=Streptomyces celluloflavus TaxID=58344 RepID=UPI003654A54D